MLLALIGCSRSPERSFEEGVRLYQAQDYPKAAAALEKAMATAPPTPQVLTMIGVCRLHAGKTEAAMQRFRAAIQLDPNHLPARYNLALAQLEAGQTEAAANALRQLAQLTGVPSEINLPLATAYNNLAVAAVRLRDIKRAEQYFELAVKADPGSVAARNLNMLRTPPAPPPQTTTSVAPILRPATPPTNTIPPQPATKSQPAPPPTPATPVVTNNIVAAPQTASPPPKTEQPASAVGAKRRPPTASRSLPTGNRDEARKYFAEAVKLQQQSKQANAIAYYTQAIKLDPSYTQAYYNLAISYRDSRQFDQAFENYELALMSDPKFHDARYNYAILLQDQGYTFDALEQYEKILHANPNDAAVHLTVAALCARDRSLRPKAREHYETYLKLVPNSPLTRDIRAWLDQNR